MAITYYFTDYPFEETSKKCNDYISSMDWDKISDVVHNEEFICLDVSDCVKVFPHLKLDKDYRLMSYISREYHGLHGLIAAIKKEESTQGKIGDDALSKMFGTVDLPETAVDPMEVIFNDGTAEGFLEAVLFSDFLCDIPNRKCSRDKILFEYPDDINSRWDVHIYVTDIRPKAVFEDDNVQIYLYYRQYARVFLPIDYRDDINLSVYSFDRYAFGYWMNKHRRNNSRYKTSVNLKEKYSAKRHNCLFKGSILQIAKEKKITSNIIVNAIKCRNCGDIIESVYDREEVTCSCGKCTVSGGHFCLTRINTRHKDYIDLSVTEEIIEE